MSQAASPSPAENLRGSPDEMLAALARLLDFAAPGRFVLAFAKCNLPVQRRALVEQLKVMLDPLGVMLLEIELTEPIDQMLPILREQLKRSYLVPSTQPAYTPQMENVPALHEDRGKVAIFVYGLEQSLPSGEPNPPMLAHLNLSRELFRRDVPCPLVLWLPDYALTLIARGAPDFWAWRAGVYEFPPQPETAQRVARMSVYGEAGHVTSSLSAEAKRERLRLLERLLDDYRELGNSPRERDAQADILWKMGSIYQDLGEWAEARARYEQALALARELDDRRAVASLLHQLGWLAQDTGDRVEARRLYDQSLQLKHELGDKQGVAATLHQLARLAQATGDLAEARRLYDQSLQLEREFGDKHGIAQTLHNLALIAQATGDLAEALRLYEQSLQLKRELGDKRGTAQTLHNLAVILQATGDLAEARRLYEQSLQLEREIGDKLGTALTMAQLAVFELSVGNFQAAIDFARQAETLMIELDNPENIARIRQQRERIENEMSRAGKPR